MRGVKHRGKEKLKVAFDVVLERATNLDSKLNGSTVFIEWKRGSKRVAGTTKRALVTNEQAVWAETISFTSTIFKDTTDRFDEKKINFHLLEVNLIPGPHQQHVQDVIKKKKAHEIGKIGLDLSQYVRSDGSELITLPLSKKNKDGPKLEVKVHL